MRAPPWDEDAVRLVVGLLARRWVLAIVGELWAGPLRRVHLRNRLGVVSDKILTDTLRELERREFVARRLYQEIPPRVDYMLTEKGRSLGALLIAVTEWSSD